MSVIVTTYKSDMLFESQIGNHMVQIDVPPAMGGSDRGPTPPDLFVASLGSCVGAFAATYCQKSGIDTRDMRVEVSFDKADSPTRLVNLAITVHLPHGDCQGREKALLRVAEHCPVHATIADFEKIDFQIVGERELALAY